MANEPIQYLDSILQEEELRWRMEEYGHDRRKYSISRSGRYKSINKKRDALKPELFKGSETEKTNRQLNAKDNSTLYSKQSQQSTQQKQQSTSAPTRTREKEEKYTKFYETNF